MRIAIGALAAMGVISLSTAAFAQGYSAGYGDDYQGGAAPMQSSKPVDNIGSANQFVLGAERLSALSFDIMTRKEPAPAGDVTQKSTGIALLGNSTGIGGVTEASVPRVGINYSTSSYNAPSNGGFLGSSSSHFLDLTVDAR